MNKRHIDDIDGMLEDIQESLHNMSKSELAQWIMELNYYNMEENDLIEDYKNYYGEIYE
jgi:hypothetical protein